MPPGQESVSKQILLALQGGAEHPREGRKRNQLSTSFDRLLSSIFVDRLLAFDVRAAEQAAAVDLVQHRKGRNIGVADLQIAGIALAQGASLATRNTKDFDDLGIPLVDPWAA